MNQRPLYGKEAPEEQHLYMDQCYREQVILAVLNNRMFDQFF